MNGITDLHQLISSMNPILNTGEFVFITLADATYGNAWHLAPIASFMEPEGLTLIIPKDRADAEAVDYDEVFRMITLQVHSSLSAVGLTAAVSKQLAMEGIPANMVAANFHDHVFVPSQKSDEALRALQQIGSS